MSRISLSGNPSGTGTFTIASPNSNSDRTVSLPDASGTVVLDGTPAAFSTLAVNGNNISAVNSLGFRNRIINGDMRIDQRNAGASVAIANQVGTYTTDRWRFYEDTDGSISVQQSSAAPAGFSNSLLVTVTSPDASLTASQFTLFDQRIEGFNVADLAWGTASASPVTMSFWVRSSVTGTYGGALANNAFNRSYPFTYAINAANTWEQKTITIVGDTTGTWLTNNSIGIIVQFGLGVGSSLSGTAGSWAASGLISATGATNLLATNGATFQITGVQLEAGSVATPFERRDYGRELIMCQRYFTRSETGQGINFGVQASTIFAEYFVQFPVAMRTSPTFSYSSLANFSVFSWAGGASRVPASMSIAFSASRKAVVQLGWASALASAGVGVSLDVNNGDFLAFSAEL